jgi:Escherichia/Staphylococcus phage prohead protease
MSNKNRFDVKNLTIPLDRKDISETGIIKGYASVFDRVDLHKDVIERGAFRKSLNDWRVQEEWPKMLWHHDTANPIGVWTYMQEDRHGLYVEGQLMLEVQKAKEIYALLKAGAINGLSIGFCVNKSKTDAKRRVRVLTDIALHEISLVTFGANPDAKVTDVKEFRNHIVPSAEIIDFTQRVQQLTAKIKKG